METTISIEFKISKEVKTIGYDDSGCPDTLTDYQFFIDGFNFDEFKGEELKDYIINELIKCV